LISPRGDIALTRYHPSALLLRGTNVRNMFAPIKFGDLGIFDTVTWDVKTETSLYLDDLFFAGSERVSET
jgi:hypothetical protein